MNLITEPNLESPDDFYEALIASHLGLSEAQSHAQNARLVLLLANHIGQLGVLKQALQAARAAGGPDEPARVGDDPTSAAHSQAVPTAPAARGATA